jgi:hypothetical protein
MQINEVFPFSVEFTDFSTLVKALFNCLPKIAFGLGSTASGRSLSIADFRWGHNTREAEFPLKFVL